MEFKSEFLVANANIRVRPISVYLANAWATRIKIKIEPSSPQCVRATLAYPKLPKVAYRKEKTYPS